MINNELMAQVIVANNMASQEYLIKIWPNITPEKNIAAILVDQGLLLEETYYQLLDYVTKLEVAPEYEQTPSQVATVEPSIAKIEETIPLITSPVGNIIIQSVSESIAQQQTYPNVPDQSSISISHFENYSPPANGLLSPQNSWHDILHFARSNDASDIHLSVNNPIIFKRYGILTPYSSEKLISENLKAWTHSFLTPEQLKKFEADGDLETIYALEGHGRFRVTLMKQRSGWEITARLIPVRVRSFEESGLPEPCKDLTHWAQGLVLVTGPVGCGKSTTLNTLVELVNQSRPDHIITLEDPLEFVYTPARCQITQRELKIHSLTQESALRAALREDPDIMVISELRDLESIQLAVSAAETGHLVFGTMNTTNASRTIYRLIDSFPPEEQGIIRNMISESLRGVISQQLIPRLDGEGLVPAYEVLMVNSAVANMIRKDEAHQLGTAMVTGKSSGMVLLDDSLRYLVEKKIISAEEANSRAINPKEFEKYLKAGKHG